MPLAHWRLTLGTALLRPLQGNATSEMYVRDGRPIRSRKLQKDCGFSGWHSVSTGTTTVALSMLGYATASFSGDFDTAREMVDRAVALNPNSSRAWEQRGLTYLIAGQPEEAIRSFERVIRLSPFDPLLFSTFAGMGVAFIGLGRFDEAVAAAKKAVRQNPLYPVGLSLPCVGPGSSGTRSRSKGGRGRSARTRTLIFAFLNG